ncbi:MAG TPA: CoA-binding protein [Candidatus Hydrogenedentes bacterium]|nr:CoA-binding protein [Candidatus Hydrogenedentota bacterium]
MPAIAIVGASPDRKKYGNKAVRAFLKGGWTVYPIHPTAREIEGVPAYPDLKSLPGPVDRVSMYVPPAVGITLIEDIAALKPREFFLNPGAESVELLEKACALGLEPVQACSIVNIGLRPDMFPDT